MMWSKLKHKYIWERIWYERLTEPIHLNLLAVFVALFGTYRAKISFDLILRQSNAFSILKVADRAKQLNLKSVTLIEFGVAAGAGLLNIYKIAEKISLVSGIDFKIYGFDTGIGMPPPQDYRDHPELYQEGDYPMNQELLSKVLPENVELIIGDLKDTVPAFKKQLSAASPIGFVSIDLDYYSSTKEALKLFLGDAQNYLPETLIYLDDIHEDSHNSFCGELLAIQEFNAENKMRKIDTYTFLRSKRIFKNAPWIDHMRVLHVLDHPLRQNLKSRQEIVTLSNPYLEQ